MSEEHIGCPGPGGSLGKCSVCGKTFMKELITGNSVAPFNVGFIEATLYCHVPDCKDVLIKAFTAAQEAEAKDGNIAGTRALAEGLPKSGPLAEVLFDWLEKQG